MRPPLSLCVEGWGLGGDGRPPGTHRASLPLQFASTARTSSSRCTLPRGSPGTLCVRTTGATATGGPPARTWATGECGPSCRHPGRILSVPPWTSRHTNAGTVVSCPGLAGETSRCPLHLLPPPPCHLSASSDQDSLPPHSVTRGCPVPRSPRSKVLAEGPGGSFL